MQMCQVAFKEVAVGKICYVFLLVAHVAGGSADGREIGKMRACLVFHNRL
jgi:hypothetical protein